MVGRCAECKLHRVCLLAISHSVAAAAPFPESTASQVPQSPLPACSEGHCATPWVRPCIASGCAHGVAMSFSPKHWLNMLGDMLEDPPVICNPPAAA